jgi:acetoin utilization protein AcuB
VGIITETDIFKILVELLGARQPGLRVTLAVHEGKGTLGELTQAWLAGSGNIISVVDVRRRRGVRRRIMIKLSEVDADTIRCVLSDLGVQVATSGA